MTQPFPENDDREFGYAVAKVTLGALPAVGGLAQEFLDRAVGSPLRRRQEEWMAELGLSLAALSAKVDGMTPDRLSEDPEFVSAVARATNDALQTHSKVKREALRNTVLNMAAGVRLDEVLIGSFMGYIERFSDAHLKLLSILRDPMRHSEYREASASIMAGSISGVIASAYPDLGADADLLSRVHADLEKEGLVNGSFKTVMSGAGLQSPQTTPIGNAFLDFISAPNVG